MSRAYHGDDPAKQLLSDVLHLVQMYDNGTGHCTSAFCDGQIYVSPALDLEGLASRKTIHPHDPECTFSRIEAFLKGTI